MSKKRESIKAEIFKKKKKKTTRLLIELKVITHCNCSKKSLSATALTESTPFSWGKGF
jgi:GTP cyclohydrolase FolE2